MTLATQHKQVVLVNGIPASGKSTLTRALASRLSLPVLTLDSVKEPFMASFAPVDRQRNRQLGCAAYQAIWKIVALAPAGCVYLIDAWFGFQPRQVLEQGLMQAGVSRALELWMAISPDEAAARYQARLSNRMPGHPGAEYLPELRRLAEQAQPMSVGPLLRLEAVDPDINAAERWLREQLQPPSLSPYAATKSLSRQD
ncbi:glucokinase [Candidatus Pantoea deserta]|uniref:Glucokinase n=1 Tax=Candidatus Pantoea deserta TaxID=1869313 RepID=A0A3N4NNI1_9GAMM|nr:AAA family ATPase [Pantoea deserta]RPD96098.1 glucokinase [Pantoea deserta]